MGTLLKDTGVLVGKVLVVDDDELMREYLSAALAAFGFDVIEARDGFEALEQYTSQSGVISLVIMDINMPRLDGFEATKKIRAFDPSARVILSSGGADRVPADVRPDAFLQKPYGGIALREIVRKVIQSE